MAAAAARPQARTVRTLYRLFLRQARGLPIEGLEIKLPVDRSAWLEHGGGHGWAPAAPEAAAEALRSLAPWAAEAGASGFFKSDALRAVVRRAFRAPAVAAAGARPSAAGSAATSDPLDRAFAGLRLLGEQAAMAASSSSATTRGVRVDVTTKFLGRRGDLEGAAAASDDEDEGEPAPPKYFYTYRIRISNLGDTTVQLLSRQWRILDPAGTVVAEVARGARGVVGCTPIIKPGTAFLYHSGTDLETPGGAMEGAFEMEVVDKTGAARERFDAEVARFAFAPPPPPRRGP